MDNGRLSQAQAGWNEERLAKAVALVERYAEADTYQKQQISTADELLNRLHASLETVDDAA